jgi:hypothetical protein
MPRNIYESYATGLRLGHAALMRNLDRFIDVGEGGPSASIGDLGEFVALYDRFLDVHHKSEDDFVFPALRSHSAGRTTDAAHLDRWSREHADIYALGRDLSRVAARLDQGGALPELARVSKTLRETLAPHLTSEEEILTPLHLAEMIPAPALEATVRSLGRANRAHAIDMASFLAESLDVAEQKAVFSDAPWLFRKVLELVGQRRMRRFRSLVRTPAIQL